MEQTTERIESEIQDGRNELRANLDELRDRVYSATDWRRQFRANPALGLGLAFGGGLLLAKLLRPKAGGAHSHPQPGAREPPGTPAGRGQLLWEAMQSALIGMTASKVTGALVERVPGFLERVAGGTPSRPASSAADNGDGGDGVHGEGNYAATRRYRARAERHLRSADVGAEELEAAEGEARSRAKDS
jgi:hypothetical protein